MIEAVSQPTYTDQVIHNAQAFGFLLSILLCVAVWTAPAIYAVYLAFSYRPVAEIVRVTVIWYSVLILLTIFVSPLIG